MSYKYGGFHDTCLEYEIITATGEILACTPTNKHKLIFKLIPAKPFVKVRYESYPTLEAYKAAIKDHFEQKDVDFMDGIIHSPTEYILSIGSFVASAPYTHSYDWMRVYYLSTKQRKEDYLKTSDYFFRYEKGVTNVRPKSFLGRLFFGKLVNASNVLRFAEKIRRFLPASKIPITLDTFIPFSKVTGFFKWYDKEVNFYPLWCVPYKIVRHYEWVNPKVFAKNNNDELFLDIAIYGMKKEA